MKIHDQSFPANRRGLSLLATILVCAALALATTLALFLVFRTEPDAERETAVRRSPMLVEVTPARKGDFRPQILSLGTVEAERDIRLSPRVGGEVVEVGPSFRPGHHVEKGDLLLRIDPADYEIALLQRRSELRQAKAELSLEKGRQEVARREVDLLREEASGLNRSLALREPQLETANARLDAARAAVRQAELNLERTHVRAPFAGQVLNRETDTGSQVQAGESLGRLIGSGEYWIFTTIPLRYARWIRTSVGEDGDEASRVRVRNRSAWPEGVFREGRVERVIGSVDEETRLVRVLVTVPDPLALQSGDGRPRLTLGSIVQCRMEGRKISSAIRLDRAYLRANDTVWVMAGGQLDIREVKVAFTDRRHAYITGGLADGERIVTTDLATVRDGAELRVSRRNGEAGENPRGAGS